MTWQPDLFPPVNYTNNWPHTYATNVAEADEAEERHSKHTQRWLVQTHLESGRTLTALEALDKYGINRLAARVNELRNAEVAVQSRMVTVASGKRVAEYYMEGQ